MEKILVEGGFEALKYLTNPYAVAGFFSLILILALGLTRLGTIVKMPSILILAVLVVVMASMLARDVFVDARRNVMVHVVRDEGRVLVSKGIELELADVETLKGEKPGGLSFNRALGSDVITSVLRMAKITGKTAEDLSRMSEGEWVQFVKSLEPTQANKLRDIPFAKFRLYVNGVPKPEFSERWYFKHDYLNVPSMNRSLEIANVYNTKHDTSLEHEAVNLRLRD